MAKYSKTAKKNSYLCSRKLTIYHLKRYETKIHFGSPAAIGGGFAVD